MPLVIGTAVLLEWMSLWVALRSQPVGLELLLGSPSPDRGRRWQTGNPNRVLTGIISEFQWQKLA